MGYKNSGTYSLGRRAPTDRQIDVDDMSIGTLSDTLVLENGAVRLAEALTSSSLSDYWPTDAGSGSTVVNENSGRDLTTDASWVSGTGVGGAHLDYDGASSSTVTDASFGAGSFTMAVWVKPTQTGAVNIIATTAGSSGNSGVNLLWDNSGNGDLGAFLNNANGGTNIMLGTGTMFTISTGTWAFLAVTLDESAAQATMYAARATDDSLTMVDQSGSYTDSSDVGDIHTIDVGNSAFTGAIDAPQYGIGQVLSQSELDSFFQESKGFFLSEGPITSGAHTHQLLPQIDPQAHTLNGKTTVVWQEYNGANNNGIMQARQYDESTGTWTETATIDTIGLDRHYSPAVVPDSSGTLHTIYGSAHGNVTKHAVSTNANDATEWDTSATNLDFPRFRYKRMHHDGDIIRIFTNFGPDGSDQKGGMISSTDAGSTWSSTRLIDIGDRWVYFTDSTQNGSVYRLNATLRYNSGGSGSDHREVVNVRYDASTDDLIGPGGSRITAPATSISDLESINAIVDNTGDPMSSQFVVRNGTPYVLFSRLASGSVAVCLSEWTGSSWSTTTIDPSVPSDAQWTGQFMSLVDTGSSLRVLETIWMRYGQESVLGEWVSTDSGATWSGRQAVRKFPDLQYGLRAIQRPQGDSDIAWIGVQETDPSTAEAGSAQLFAFDANWNRIGPV